MITCKALLGKPLTALHPRETNAPQSWHCAGHGWRYGRGQRPVRRHPDHSTRRKGQVDTVRARVIIRRGNAMERARESRVRCRASPAWAAQVMIATSVGRASLQVVPVGGVVLGAVLVGPAEDLINAEADGLVLGGLWGLAGATRTRTRGSVHPRSLPLGCCHT